MSYKQMYDSKPTFDVVEPKESKGKDSEAAYEEYLLLLQQRNRLLKKLKEKDQKQLDLEKREQGFSLYLNGANVGLQISGNQRPRKSKSAGDSRSRLEKDDERLKTAPKPVRKGWQDCTPDQIRIKTKDGDKIVHNVPEVLTGNYEDDFDAYQSLLQTKLEEEEEEKESAHDNESDGEREASSYEEESDDDNDVMEQQLTFTVEDLKTLRASLERDSSICKSIEEAARDYSTDEDENSDDEQENNNRLKPPSLRQAKPSSVKKSSSLKSADLSNCELEEIDEEVEDSLDMSLIMTAQEISEEIIAIENSSDECDSEDDKNSKPGHSEAINADTENIKENINDIEIAKNENKSPLETTKIRNNEKPIQSNFNAEQQPVRREKDGIVELHGAVPKNRPVTASRRRNENIGISSVTSSVMSVDLAQAIEEENRRLEEYKGKRESNTAPEVRTKEDSNKKQTLKRPQTIAHTLTDIDITSITERVRRMTGRQQRKLLRMLAELEDAEKTQSITDLETEHIPVAFESPPLLTSDSTGFISNVKPTLLETDIHIAKNISARESLSTGLSRTDGADSEETSDGMPRDQKLHVLVELLSNWGNEKYIGLTEIQFLKKNNEAMRIRSRDIRLIDEQMSDDLKVLINGKMKTMKEKYMWKTKFTPEKPIRLEVILQNVELSEIYKIVLWNYNKSLHDLSTGVKECRISMDNDVVWEGIIDKGCGNKIFDYSKTIPLKEEIGYSDVSTTSAVRQEGIKTTIDKDEHPIKTNKLTTIATPKTSVPINFPTSKPQEIRQSPYNNEDDDHIERPSTRTTDRSNENIKNLPVAEETIVRRSQKAWTSPRDSNESSESKQKNKNLTTSSCGIGKPVWLSESPKVKRRSNTDVNEDYIIDESLKPRSRPSSGRRSQLQTPSTATDDEDFLTLEDNVKPRSRPSSGRRSNVGTPERQVRSSSVTSEQDEEDKNKRDLDLLFDLNVKQRRRQHQDVLDSMDVRKSMLASEQPVLIDMSGKETKKSERQKFKEIVDVNLEQSFRSIDKFNSHHLGRITSMSSLSADEDFGSFLEPMSEKDLQTLHEKITRSADGIDDYLVENMLENNVESVDENLEEEIHEDSPRFELPLLPKGKELIMNIKTTWGDRHYVGLNGIEIFTADGNKANIKTIQANPKDINILPEYEGDPRVVANLIDGCYLTRDDLHLWLTPFTAGLDHLLSIEFDQETTISMIRLWNYNKSRIHSSRGARFVEMALDGKLIFLGEIARASGVLSAEDPYGDMILYTVDEEILERVARNDPIYVVEADSDEEDLASSFDLTKRPSTATDENSKRKDRPFTAPKSRESQRPVVLKEYSVTHPSPSPENDGFMECSVLCLFFTTTWGDLHYMGLTGLEVLGDTFESLPLKLDQIEANPRDLNDLEDYDDDDRTLDKLFNGVNVTTHDENMWMIPFETEGTQFLKITFEEPTIVTGLRIWNYNKSLEDTFRGAKTMHVYMDEEEVSPKEGFLLRKGPGHCHFDFAQDVFFHSLDSAGKKEKNMLRQRKVNLQKIVNEYETMMMPCGFLFQFQLYSTWGDQYYIGLNGLEVYDELGEIISLTDNNITAFPHSINVLAGVDDDIRTPDKLVDGVYDTHDGRNMWLAPILPGQVNIIYIVFDEPVTISMIKIWNYSKTPTRGVRQFGLLVDDLLVYSGALPQPALFARGIVPGAEVPVMHHTILFTDQEEIVVKEKKFLLSSSVSVEEQGVTLTNEKSVLQSHKDKYTKVTVDQAMRPMTSVKGKGKH